MGLDPGLDHMSARLIMDDIKSQHRLVMVFSSNCGGLPTPKVADNLPSTSLVGVPWASFKPVTTNHVTAPMAKRFMFLVQSLCILLHYFIMHGQIWNWKACQTATLSSTITLRNPRCSDCVLRNSPLSRLFKCYACIYENGFFWKSLVQSTKVVWAVRRVVSSSWMLAGSLANCQMQPLGANLPCYHCQHMNCFDTPSLAGI